MASTFLMALFYFSFVVYEKNELVCYVIASHSQMFSKMPFFTSVALVVVYSVLLVNDISETINLLHNI